MKVNRVKTGIKGFDRLVDGGFPLGSSTLVCGTPGTGKTIFALQYIYNGAKQFKEKSLYISFEQNENDLREQAELLGWNLKEVEKKGLLKLKSYTSRDLTAKTVDEILNDIKKNKYKRLVIDSISTLAINAPIYESSTIQKTLKQKQRVSPIVLGELVTKRFLYDFITQLKRIDHCTSLLVSEASEKGEFLSRDTISEFICDGVILMTFESMGGEFSRSMLVRKMRRTNCNEDIHPVEISGKGIAVHDIE